MTDEISPEALSDRLRTDDDLLVLDIRHADEFDEWHIPGSINVEVYDLLGDDPDAAADALADLPAGKEIVTVCAAGVRSQEATEVLRDLGYTARTLTDGMNGWSRVHRSATVPTDLDGTLIQVARPGKGCLSHVLISRGEAAVFDPSQYVEVYESILDDHDADLVGVFDSHAHADHVSGARRLAERSGAPYHLHPADAIGIEVTPLSDGSTIDVGAVTIEVIHTPGHSPGGVTFDLDGVALITGDTLFHESVGRVELGVAAGLEGTAVEENAGALYDSVHRLLDRDGDPYILPAHDPGSPDPPVTARLSAVRERNPDLRRDRDAFVELLAGDVPEHPPNFERVKRHNVGAESIPDDELAALELGPNRCAAE